MGGHDSAYYTWPWTNPSSVTRQLCDLERELHLSEVRSASSAKAGAYEGVSLDHWQMKQSIGRGLAFVSVLPSNEYLLLGQHW